MSDSTGAARARFTDDYDHVTTRRPTPKNAPQGSKGTPLGMVSYQKGYEGPLPRSHLAGALEAGKAVEIDSNGKEVKPTPEAPKPDPDNKTTPQRVNG